MSPMSDVKVITRVIGPHSAFHGKCFTEIEFEQISEVMKMFNYLTNKQKQDIYLGSPIYVGNVARERTGQLQTK